MKSLVSIFAIFLLTNNMAFSQDVISPEEIFQKLEAQSTRSKIGQHGPNIEMKSIDGRMFHPEQFKGKPTIIFAWSVNCQYCLDQIGLLRELQKALDDNYNFISITADDIKDVKATLYDYPFDFTHLAEAHDYLKLIGANGQPRIILLDEFGVIRQSIRHNDLKSCRDDWSYSNCKDQVRSILEESR